MRISERDKMLSKYFIDKEYMGGIRRFEKVPLEVVVKLVSKGFLKPHERQNLSPSTIEFIKFAKEWKKQGIEILFHGYVVSKKRDDCRITLEGMQTKEDYTDNKKFLASWFRFAITADDLSANYCWWD